MLRRLSIRNVVLIDRLDLSFESGLSVLTGETGAGKSILLDALGLALGRRAESGLLRNGSDAATVSAEFSLPAGHRVLAMLEEQALPVDPVLILRRQLSADGRSRAFINDETVSIGLLRRVGDALVEIAGQFESHGLLDPATHADLLDAFAGHAADVDRMRAGWREWRSTVAAREAAEAQLVSARREEAFLRHAVAELTAMDPKPGEEAQLSEERTRLMNAEKLGEAVQGALGELIGERGADNQLAGAQRRLDRIADKAGKAIEPAISALDRAANELAEAIRELQRAAIDLEADPRRLEAAEERLFAIRDLARKHGVDADALAAHAASLAEKLAALDDEGGRLATLSRAEAAARDAYRAAAASLSKGRMTAARKLDKAVNGELPPLKLERARFATKLDRLEENDWNENGIDRIAFEIATNPGSEPGALAKIASGGELARFMLALKVVLAASDPVPTLVFDEVDAGIGGATAAAVGARLARLADSVQVLVVTHSPQVAARGLHHWRVEKQAKDGSALTMVEPLDDAGRREEIARMLSGARITDAARAQAEQLIAGGGA
ncbi:MAG: DNA repair protein RecN [Dongiaceae bacterium]